ncbi:GAF domain-containing protein [Streptacidiphilus sp. ASG 303]|uniref:sensor histidine kinase n=1 Tax=Streptacidiphilus sp. ASG 303 TaxID=2896847 RepID=UPI001E64A14F|nr:GAF domain-containing protein [Streptacidiphilus sp. ASG 303]MCD0484022.1 GAF domain-containing protein [Streptacidiphilus sp. ASG 303]
MRLDELLEELQARIDAARGTRDRVHSLLEAVLSVGRELDLTQVLRTIVEAGATLVDARYAALGVIGPDGRTLSQFLTVGLSQGEVDRIGPLPSGHGLLGELIRHPESLRIEELSRHPASYGFPSGHPPMRTFLGVPIRVRGEVFGNLYLTDKQSGARFDAEDEAVISTLAVAAGVAIDNARLYEEAQRRQAWLRASSEITSNLLSGGSQEQVLELIAERTREFTASQLVDIAMPGAPGELAVRFSAGEHAEHRRGMVLPFEGTLSGAAYTTGEPAFSADIGHDPRVTAGPPRFAGLGPAVAVPMGTAEKEVRGVVLLARGKDEQPFTEEEVRPLLGFAGQAALALELAAHRRDAEQLAILEDRDRIARDLHDLAIQRLFATGMTLQSAGRFIDHPEAADRVMRAVDDLDETIKIIRSTIFGLRARDSAGEASLRARAARAAEEAAAALGFAPRLSMEGLLDTDVPPATADHVVAVLREALSNAARHARARRVEADLRATDSEVVLTVTDDGVGIPGDGRRSGLRNLAERAEQLGGTLLLEVPQGGGTRLVWRAPLQRD